MLPVVSLRPVVQPPSSRRGAFGIYIYIYICVYIYIYIYIYIPTRHCSGADLSEFYEFDTLQQLVRSPFMGLWLGVMK